VSGSAVHQPLPVAARPPVFARTKFVAPQPPATLVPRHALVQGLIAADHLPLTIVVGAPGSGKSSLLAEWFHSCDDGSVAWLHADRGDDDPARFWRAFIGAIQQVEPSFGVEAADLITLDGGVSDDALESMLADDAAMDERVRLVIDDFHVVGAVAAQQLQHLLIRGLGQLRLLIGSRSDPAVGLHRLRLERSVREVREADLRLGLTETRALVSNLGIDADTIDVQALLDRTEGWAAGVQLAALSAVGSDDPAARIRELAGTTQTIAGYLITELMANQPAHLRAFLEDTCVVDELDAALCHALTQAEGPAGRVTLEEVESAHLLLSRVDGAGTVFRYHLLFAELLRHGVRARDPEHFREQHLRAAEHYERIGDISSAVRHYWSAGRADLGAKLLRIHIVNAHLSTGAPPPIDLSFVPGDAAIAASPGDAVGYAVGLLLNGQNQAAVALVRRADAAARAANASIQDRVLVVGAALATEFATGNARAAIPLAEEFQTLVTDGDFDDEWVSTSIALGARACAWEGEFDLGRSFLEGLRTRAHRFSDVDVAGAWALLELEAGRVDDAVEHGRFAASAAEQLGLLGAGTDFAARTAFAAALLEAGWLDDAATEVHRLRQVLRGERAPAFTLAMITSARLLRVLGEFDAALRELSQARDRLRTAAPGPTLLARVDIASVWVHLAVGQIDAARTVHDRLPPGFRTHLVGAWIATMSRDWPTVDELSDTLETLAVTRRERFDVLLWSLRTAIDRPGRAEQVEPLAEQLLDATATTGMVLPIAEAGAAVLQAVVSAARRRPRTDLIERLLVTQPLPRPADQARQNLVDDLSNRELVVLRYMATSMTNQEIADALYLSVNTVKTHIKHVLRKLNATSRAEATRRAQELHYL
jgi:LuxR family transcriptional regulator, maltose regulon positive regulatory protein